MAYGNSSRLGSTGTSLLGQGAMALGASGTDATSLAGGIRRHLIVVHVTLGLRTGQCVDLLFHLEHVQGGDAQNLGFATLEQCGTVHARNTMSTSADRVRMSRRPRPSMR